MFSETWTYMCHGTCRAAIVWSIVTESDVRFADLYDRFYRPVYGYCRRRSTADQVDDVVAETFLIAWRRIDLVPRGSEVLPWLYGVAYRVLGNEWRSSSRRHKLERKLSSIGYQSPPPPYEVMVARQESRQVVAALESLKPIDREVLLLAAWEELAQADIAVVLNIGIEAVRQRLYQAKKNLEKAYDRLQKRRTTPAARKGGAW